MNIKLTFHLNIIDYITFLSKDKILTDPNNPIKAITAYGAHEIQKQMIEIAVVFASFISSRLWFSSRC